LERHAVRALLAAATAAAAITAFAQTKEVEVGLIAPMSGPYARQGQVMKMAADMAVETINQQGGIKSMAGPKLKLSSSTREIRSKERRMRTAHGGQFTRPGWSQPARISAPSP